MAAYHAMLARVREIEALYGTAVTEIETLAKATGQRLAPPQPVPRADDRNRP
jgi:hypothetical protein